MPLRLLRLGITNTYLIKGQGGYLLVDAGDRGQEKRFFKLLKGQGIAPEEIKLIIITHAHFDHVGSLAGIKKVCSCPVLIHKQEKDILAAAQVVIPPGTTPGGKILSTLGKALRWHFRFKPVLAEIAIEEEFDLHPYGFAGKVFPTPGHTAGSLSVLLDDGRALVGDLAMNYIPGSIYPIFAELPQQVYNSWQQLVQRGAARIYPAHGRPFAVDRIIKSRS